MNNNTIKWRESLRAFDNISNTAITWTYENNRVVFDEKHVRFHLRDFRCDRRRNGVELNILRHRIANSFGCIRLRLRDVQVLQHDFSDDESLLGRQVEGAWEWSNCGWSG